MADFPEKVLIANRGEIAVRVMRTCRELGIPTVAVYSDVDRDALHVRHADEAYALGGQTAAESYLNTPAILDAIARSGATAVHPGYGFFSENADFARKVTEAGVTWIGPPPSAIDLMGDKVTSRRTATAADVAGVPGTLDPVTKPEEVLAFAEEHGYPVAIKAAFGGGGRGMKVVRDAASVPEAMESAQREAQAYFGRPEIYVERYLERPRHVEVQIFCDTHGNGVYLGERDCSVQRRHQKLIEESPAPGLSEETRRAMGEAALKVAAACGYVNAGTVEFLYAPPGRGPDPGDGDFFFLEMNTRLQVEHCVTELVTGLDLVEEQLRVAAGGKLSFTQDSVERRGHAIECRINAEDPANGFRPSPGLITKFNRPDGFGVRVDAGYDAGLAVSQYYDNLTAKLITWGPDREAARRRMLRALGEFEIEGVRTTIPAQMVLLAEPAFIEGKHSTKWLEEEVDPALLTAAAASAPTGAPPAEGTAEALIARTVPVEVDGRRFEVKVWLPEAPEPLAGGGAAPAGARGGRSGRPRSSAGAGAAGSGEVASPMQGTIVKTLVSVGDAVEIGQAVVVLEAMKMENHINAEKAGTVSEVRVSPGDTVGTGDVLVVIT
ncbi:MAG: acetyl-CoA/propionyl-CoA carboxylase, biotin carboxylase, biotin carboxyl carrier protein [Actinomycetota bacterium]|nr:acetyl-CoA/propionyl-CoA carboxylase, biotin carboxylase, biotin carboxyl carrier protein [Actinomycetota bacterium]